MCLHELLLVYPCAPLHFHTSLSAVTFRAHPSPDAIDIKEEIERKELESAQLSTTTPTHWENGPFGVALYVSTLYPNRLYDTSTDHQGSRQHRLGLPADYCS